MSKDNNWKEQIEMLVRAHVRLDEHIDVCTEDGELLLTCSHLQWFGMLKPIRINGKSVYKFTKNGEDYYTLYEHKFKQIKEVLDNQNKPICQKD